MKELIKLEHGSGGKLTFELIKNVFLKNFNIKENEFSFEDSFTFETKSIKKIAFTTDSYVITPIFFRGGDIGKLAICGTINDLAVSGAIPYFISAAFIIEEGFEIDKLRVIIKSMEKVAKEAKVKIVCGDTKVVEKGKADGLFINTSGIGFFEKDLNFSYKNPKPGDLIIINGEIASHGIAILNDRHNLKIDFNIRSDVSPLNGIISNIREIDGVRCMKDLTRGGLAEGLIEISSVCGYGMEIEEDKIPISSAVRSACEIIGIDPLYVANEGKFIVIVSESKAKEVLSIMKKHKYGSKSSIIGRIIEDKKVYLKTLSGMRRIITSLTGEQLPRIC